MLKFIVNDRTISTDYHPGMLLIDFIREHLNLKGTKEACREGECGACTVLVGKLNQKGKIIYKSCASCILPIGGVENCHVVTVEGVNMEKFNTVQQKILDNGASQCGFCTPGIVLSLTAYCLTSKDFSYTDALNALDGNICRCTGYVSIRKAAKELSESLKGNDINSDNRVEMLVENSVLPDYFLNVPAMLKDLNCDSIEKKFQEDSVIVSGGTDLFVQRPEELANSSLFFMEKREDLKYITIENNYLSIGGAVTIEEVRLSDTVYKVFPELKEYLLKFASTLIRNKATLSGNIVNASPIGETPVLMLSLGALLVIENAKSEKTREIRLDKFYKGYKKYDLQKGEIIREIKIPIPKEEYFFNFEKISNRKTLDIAAVNSGFFATQSKNGNIDALRISAGGVAPVPLAIEGLEKFKGERVEKKTVLKITEYVLNHISPIDDIRGSAKYKNLLSKQIIFLHFKNLFPEIEQGGKIVL